MQRGWVLKMEGVIGYFTGVVGLVVFGAGAYMITTYVGNNMVDAVKGRVMR
mgnify:CR=1 FL=1